MTLSDIAIILPSITAIAAIVVPALTSAHASKTQVRIKKYELYTPRVYDALSGMAEAYSLLVRGEMLPETESEREAVFAKASTAYYSFTKTAYTVMSLIPKKDVQSQITELISEISTCYCIPNLDHDKRFCELMNDITEYMRDLKM